MRSKLLILLVMMILLLASCAPGRNSTSNSDVFPGAATVTPSQPLQNTPKAAATLVPTLVPSPTPYPVEKLVLWIDPAVPDQLSRELIFPEEIKKGASVGDANIQLGINNEKSTGSEWVYALVAPFPTIPDGVSLEDLRKAWAGGGNQNFEDRRILMSASTEAAFSTLWGAPSIKGIRVANREDLLDLAWSTRPAWAIVPFENLDPRWKVLQVGGMSPLDKHLNVSNYPLVIHFGFNGNEQELNALGSLQEQGLVVLPSSNRDVSRMTTLVMTGTTALVRATAAKMDSNGVTYPARDIRDWLVNADLTHISNEVSFAKTCPPGNPYQKDMQFCSRPEYIGLLDYIGTDIVELTGNHLGDWDWPPFLYTLDLYRQKGWYFYGAGENIERARAPIRLESNGNKIAFIGCRTGPPPVWATEMQPGGANCDFAYIEKQINHLKSDGYLPIMTFQYNESYQMTPLPAQKRDFGLVSDAGAFIVQGSQAHYPQGFEFRDDRFIHFGPGNLFFDQMNIPVMGTRREFIDRHVIYNGRLISTELLTAMLEDYCRPRPMTPDERISLLHDAFAASGW